MTTPTINSLMKSGNFWFPAASSTVASHMDFVFWFILGLSILFFTGIVGTMGYFMLKYRRSAKNPTATATSGHHDLLEITWTIIPLVLVVIIFYMGFTRYLELTVPPKNGIDITVIAKKWLWQFYYPSNQKQTIGNLVVPVHTPINLTMSSDDIIHSFFVPHFRVKQDVLPNRYSHLWFEATKTGVYPLFCTEYCGDGHSKMLGTVTVLSAADYLKWESQKATYPAGMSPVEIGEKVAMSKGCAACHSVTNEALSGPAWNHIYGTQRKFTTGKSGIVDDTYLRKSIIEPAADVVSGYQPVMPSYAGSLSDDEIRGIIAYIKSLK